MTTQIFVHKNVPDKNTFLNAIKETIDVHTNLNLMDKYDPNINRIGFVWDNDSRNIPFTNTELTIDNYTFKYFKKELYNYLQLYNNMTVDLITCYLNNPLFLSEVEIIKNNLNNINIEYSLDATGNLNGNWIMESNNSSILDVYFNNSITDYKYILGSIARHNAIIADNGTVWTFGENSEGQLGLNDTVDRNIPVQIAGITNAIMVSCGGTHTAIIDDSNRLWTFGDNTNGQLGNGTTNSSPIPIEITGIPNAVTVSCGNGHTAVIDASGAVWTFGYNEYGQLGDNGINADDNPIPRKAVAYGFANQILVINNAIGVSCGDAHTVVIRADNTVWTFGWNSRGQLGNGSIVDSNPNSVARQVVFDLGGILGPFEDVIAASAGGQHTMLLKSNGTVWTFGGNYTGQLGNGTIIDNAIPAVIANISAIGISCGLDHSIILKDDNTVCTFGGNSSGQLGNGTMDPSSNPVQVEFDCSGNGVINVVAVSGGNGHTTILQNDGTVLTFGANFSGQLGNNTTVNSDCPREILFSSGVSSIMDAITLTTEEITTEEITTEGITTEEITIEIPTQVPDRRIFGVLLDALDTIEFIV
jgi:alpha-tubulin suppressor-like RCC1 family protein